MARGCEMGCWECDGRFWVLSAVSVGGNSLSEPFTELTGYTDGVLPRIDVAGHFWGLRVKFRV